MFQPIGGAWKSPTMLARCKQTDSRRRNQTQQEEDLVSRSSIILLCSASSTNSERLDNFCSTSTSTKSSTAAVVVVMGHRGVQRWKARGRGAGRWRHRYAKYADSPSTRENKGSVFKCFHPETRSQKSVFTGSMRTIGWNDATRVFPCGLSVCVCVCLYITWCF